MKKLLSPFIDALFPPFCRWCHHRLDPGLTLLCKNCLDYLFLLEPNNRCPSCFQQLENSSHRCYRRYSCIKGVAFCFEDSLALRSLFNSAQKPHPLSSFFLLQWQQLRWPMPDYILATPGDWFSGKKWKSRQSLAHSFAHLLQQPYLPLYIDRFHLPKPLLSLEKQPKRPLSEAIYLKDPSKIVNKRVLIIDSITESGQALSLAAKALLNYGALEVRALGGVCSGF